MNDTYEFYYKKLSHLIYILTIYEFILFPIENRRASLMEKSFILQWKFFRRKVRKYIFHFYDVISAQM